MIISTSATKNDEVLYFDLIAQPYDLLMRRQIIDVGFDKVYLIFRFLGIEEKRSSREL